MRLTRFADPATFLDAIEPALLVREAEHSLMLGSVAALAREGGSTAGAPYLAAIHDGERLLVAATMSGTRPLLLASDLEDADAGLSLLVADLSRERRKPAAVHGRGSHAGRFARLWSAETGAAARLVMAQRLHALTVVRDVPIPSGALRPARGDDLPLLAEWKVAFEREAIGAADEARVRASAARRLGAGEMYVWEGDDGAVRTMAASARPTRHTIAVNAVYTPPAHRGRGYATACVARLSERLLAAGWRTCVLFTDLANPTSNSIYARVGYAGIGEFELYGVE